MAGCVVPMICKEILVACFMTWTGGSYRASLVLNKFQRVSSYVRVLNVETYLPAR